MSLGTLECMKTLGQKLRELRAARDMSQRALAEYVSNQQAQVSRWEQDASEPPYGALLKMSAIFRVPIRYLVDPECERPEDAVEVPFLTDDEASFLKMVRKLGTDRAMARLLLLKDDEAAPDPGPATDYSTVVQHRFGKKPASSDAEPDADPDPKPGKPEKPEKPKSK